MDTGPVKIPIEPCLATEATQTLLDATRGNPAWVWQPKFDGTRLVVQGQAGWHRSGKPTELPPGVWGPEGVVLDGEYLDNGWYVVFDAPLVPLPYWSRLEWLEAHRDQLGPKVQLVRTAMSSEEKTQLEQLVHSLDQEGLVVKRATARHVGGRSDIWQKVKRWKTTRVKVTAVNAKRHTVDVEGIETLMTSGAASVDNRGPIAGTVSVPPKVKLPAVGALGEVRYIKVTQELKLYHATWLRTAAT